MNAAASEPNTEQSLSIHRASRQLSALRLRPVISAEEAFKVLGINRSTGYKAIRDGTFPLPTFKVGNKIRIPTAAVLRLLQLKVPAEAEEPEEEMGA